MGCCADGGDDEDDDDDDDLKCITCEVCGVHSNDVEDASPLRYYTVQRAYEDILTF